MLNVEIYNFVSLEIVVVDVLLLLSLEHSFVFNLFGLLIDYLDRIRFGSLYFSNIYI